MIFDNVKKIMETDLFRDGKDEKNFVGRSFYIDFETISVLVCDAWKKNVGGIPNNCFLLAFNDAEEETEEILLLRVISPKKLPADNDICSSMIEHYKEGNDISGLYGSSKKSKLDPISRFEYSFSGLECRILGSFYKVQQQIGGQTVTTVKFGADIDNFYSANNYSIYKPTNDVLKRIVNHSSLSKEKNREFKIGHVRYSSSSKDEESLKNAHVYLVSEDFIGKRTSVNGMTRTGKSNTVKTIIKQSDQMSMTSINDILPDFPQPDSDKYFIEGKPKYPIGQIIFDINGEYANSNSQGDSIYELLGSEKCVRYSTIEKKDFRLFKTNFYKEIENGFNLIKAFFSRNKESSDYLDNFLAIDLSKPEILINGDKKDPEYRSALTRYHRKISAYLCCLYKAEFTADLSIPMLKFKGNQELNALSNIHPNITQGISFKQATTWFETIWENYESDFFTTYKKDEGHEWADDDLQTLMIFLSGYKKPNKNTSVSGYKKLCKIDLKKLHNPNSHSSFKRDIVKFLRQGKVIILDLSLGDTETQELYSEQICEAIFDDSMNRFTQELPNNFIQFYFEEAHNLFPKEGSLKQIYNRLAKEGAKLQLGMVYATQEVSSISKNILKNTQNWFIAHLNNKEELKELEKYYDFSDFSTSIMKFSPETDKGFVRVKTYSNPFVIPVQIDEFKINTED